MVIQKYNPHFLRTVVLFKPFQLNQDCVNGASQSAHFKIPLISL